MGAAETVRHWVEKLARTRLGFSMDDWNACSGDLLDAADTIERLQKERDEALKQFSLDASQAQNQIDKAAAQRVEIRDLQGRLWSVRESRDQARKERDEQKEKADERGESFAKAIQDYNTMREERDAALAEVERLKALLQSVVTFAEEAHAKWDADEDMRVGKMLVALAGGLPRYRPDTDAIHAALKS